MSTIHYSSAEIMGAIEALSNMITAVQRVQSAHTQAFQSIAQQETNMATNIEMLQGKVDDLKADVKAGRVSIDAAVAAFNGVTAQYKAAKDQLDELIKNNGTPEQFKALSDSMDEANTEMDKQRADLDAVVTQSTPPPA
jgi:predicted  nucleic acid-binding Zn-ribbon protein